MLASAGIWEPKVMVIRLALVFFVCTGTVGVYAAADDVAKISLHFGADGVVDAYLDLEQPAPDNKKALQAAWNALMDATGDGADGSYFEGSRTDIAVPAGGFLRRGQVDLAPLQAPLRAAGLSALEVLVALPPAAVQEVAVTGLEGFERFRPASGPLGTSGSGEWRLSADPPLIEVTYGYTVLDAVKSILALLVIGLACLVWAAFARVNAGRADDRNAPFLCFRYARQYDWMLYGTWAASALYGIAAHPFDWISYAGPWPARNGVAMQILLLCLPSIPLVAARVLLHPIFARYPDTTWSRGDFLAQGIWANLRAAAIAAGLLLYNADHYGNGSPLPFPFAVIVLSLSAMLASHFYQRALGVYSQILGEGDVYDVIVAAGARLKQKPTVEMLHYNQCPLGVVFKASVGMVQLSNVALATLTRSEFKAVLMDALIMAEREKQGLVTGGAAAAGFLGVWGTIGGLAVDIFRRATPAQKARASWTVELEQSIDPRALIRGLVKLNRLNQTMQGTDQAEVPFKRNPALEEKIQNVAERSEIGPAALVALLELPDADGGDYYIPGGADTAELLKPSYKQRAAKVFAVLAFVLPLLPAVALAAYQAHTGNSLGEDRWVLGGAVIAGAVLLYLLQNYGGDWEYRKTQRALQPRLAESGTWDLDATYVGLAPCSEKRGIVQYNGSETWDEGYLSLQADAITYQGMQASFSIPRDRVHNIRLTCEFPGMLLPFYRIRVDWRAAGREEPRTFTFTAAAAFSRSGHNRDTRALFGRLIAWGRQDATFRPSAQAPQFPAPDGLDPTANVIGHATMVTAITVFILMPLAGKALSLLAGLPTEGPLSASTNGVLVVSLAMAAILTLLVLFHRAYGARTLKALRDEG